MPPYSDPDIELARQQLLRWCERYPKDGIAMLVNMTGWSESAIRSFRNGNYVGNVRLLADDLKKVFDRRKRR